MTTTYGREAPTWELFDFWRSWNYDPTNWIDGTLVTARRDGVIIGLGLFFEVDKLPHAFLLSKSPVVSFKLLQRIEAALHEVRPICAGYAIMTRNEKVARCFCKLPMTTFSVHDGDGAAFGGIRWFSKAGYIAQANCASTGSMN